MAKQTLEKEETKEDTKVDNFKSLRRLEDLIFKSNADLAGTFLNNTVFSKANLP
jgi:hypothetical protein